MKQKINALHCKEEAKKLLNKILLGKAYNIIYIFKVLWQIK